MKITTKFTIPKEDESLQKELRISEIQFTPVKSVNGLIAFVSFVINESLYLSSIGIITRPNGGYRLLYPTKKNIDRDFPIFHPISRNFGIYIEEVILTEYEKVMKKYDRYSSINNSSN